MGVFDPSILIQQHEAIQKGLNQMDQDMMESIPKSKDPYEGKSMSEILREKREATEKILESTHINQQESIEDRRQRLRAHRDLLLKQKNDQRQNELKQFNTKASTKQDLFKELKEMDNNLKRAHDIPDYEDQPMDKRLALYKNLRDQMITSQKQSNLHHDSKAKMDELNKRIEVLERASRMKDFNDKERQAAIDKDSHKGFLDGIKSYKVDEN